MSKFLEFKEKIKLYVFKDEGEVNVSFFVNDHCTINKRFTIEEMTRIVDDWYSPGVSGFETEDSGRIWWEHRNCGPRPDCEPADFVAISIQGWNFRLTVNEMENLVVNAFKHQLSTKNHWD